MRIRGMVPRGALAIAATLGTVSGALLITAPAYAASDTAGQCATTVAGATGSSGQVDQTFTAPAGNVIFEVCVKAGSTVTGGPYYFTSNTGGQVAPINGTVDPNCYVRTGLGTQTASVTDGTGNGCHSISHLVFFFQPGGSGGNSPGSTPGGNTTSNGGGTGAGGTLAAGTGAAPGLPAAGAIPTAADRSRALAGILVVVAIGVLIGGLFVRRYRRVA